jgi:hypothetical protein
MKNNKKGLSTIVATLLIILLTLVAVGIIWVVVRQLVVNTTDDVEFKAKCLDAEVSATKVTNASTDYFVTLTRKAGKEAIGGVTLVFTNAAETSNVVRDVPGNIAALGTITTSALSVVGLPNPDKVSVVVFFLDDSGNKKLCETANQYKFA